MNHQLESERLINLHYMVLLEHDSELSEEVTISILARNMAIVTCIEIINVLESTVYYKQERYNDYIKVKQILEKY